MARILTAAEFNAKAADLERRNNRMVALIVAAVLGALEAVPLTCDCCGGHEHVTVTGLDALCDRCRWTLANPTVCPECGGEKDAHAETCYRCSDY